MTRQRWWAAVLVLAAVGFGLRAWNLDFDQRQHQHPDERHWAITSDALSRAPEPARHGTVAGPLLDWLDGDRSPANPYRATESFVYGPASLAASRSLAGWMHQGVVDGDQPAAAIVEGLDRLGLPLLDDAGAPRFDDRYQVDLVGRLLGVVIDTLTIIVVALVGRRIGGRATGLVAAGLAATSILAIQHAHFFGSEPALGLAAALVVLACVSLDRCSDTRRSVLGGGLVGLATGALLAVKVTGVGLALVPAGGLLALVVIHQRKADWIRLAAAGTGAYLAFRVLHPAAFSGFDLIPGEHFVDDLRRNRQAAAADMPPALQWAGRSSVVDGLRWLFLFTVGPGTFLAAVVGVVTLAGRSALDRWTRAVLVAGCLMPLAFVLRGDVFTGRYFVPMLPALHVVAAVGVLALWRSREHVDRRIVRRAVAATSLVCVALAALWAAGFVVGVHGREHTRVQASHWIAAHVPAGSVLSSQAWDDGLPLSVPGVDTTRYQSEQLDLFGPDSVEKSMAVARALGRIDYVVESSPRVWGTVTRIPARFPSTIRFFEALDDGSLGFERVATFDRDIGLGSLRLSDDSAEEAFSVYDHPEVRIWEKVIDLPARDRLAALDPVAAAGALPVHWAQGSANGAQMLPEERAQNEDIGTFADDVDEGGSALLHALGWLVVVELLGLATFVILAPALRSLPDAGAGLAKLVGLVVVTTGVFVIVTWGGQALSATSVGAVVVVWLALGGWCASRRRRLIRELWRSRRRAIVQVECLTLVAFAVMLLVRSANPDLWHVARGGEKLFELEMLTATMRTRTLPPYDPWFAGGTLNYYYGGYLLLSVPARLLRTAPAVAFNLAVPLVASLIAGAAFSAGAAVSSLARTWRLGSDRLVAGVHRRAGLLTTGVLLLVPNAAILPKLIDRLVGDEQGAFDWWALSRTIPGSPAPTEFPAWSLLFADLHPHLIGLPLLLAVVPLAIAWCRHLRDERGRVPAVAVGLVLGSLLGTIRAVNTWDLPLAALLVAMAVLTAAAPPIWRATALWLRTPRVRTDPSAEPAADHASGVLARPSGAWPSAIGAFVRRLGAAWWRGPVDPPPRPARPPATGPGQAHRAADRFGEGLRRARRFVPSTKRRSSAWQPTLPFARTPLVVSASLPADPVWPGKAAYHRWIGGLVAVAATALVAWAPYAARTEVTDAGIEIERRFHTPGASWLAMWGILAAATVLVVLVVLGRAWAHRGEGVALAGGGLAIVVVAVPERRVLAVTVVLAAAAGTAAWASHRDGDRSRSLVLPACIGALGWTMQAGIEVFSVINDFDRQNTIFKGWFQSWTLLCVGLVPALAQIAAPAGRLWSPVAGLGVRRRREAIGARAWFMVALLLAVAFARLAVPARLDDRSSDGGPSLDGTAFLDADLEVGTDGGPIRVRSDRPLIEWLKHNVAGAVVITEYPHNDYSWSTRMAALTGLTAPVGWPYHQSQQRRSYGEIVRDRETDLRAMYEDGDQRALTATLQRMRVSFVIWGATEQALGTPEAREAIRSHPCLEVVFTSAPLFIAEVDQRCLSDRPGGLPIAPARD